MWWKPILDRAWNMIWIVIQLKTKKTLPSLLSITKNMSKSFYNSVKASLHKYIHAFLLDSIYSNLQIKIVSLQFYLSILVLRLCSFIHNIRGCSYYRLWYWKNISKGSRQTRSKSRKRKIEFYVWPNKIWKYLRIFEQRE